MELRMKVEASEWQGRTVYRAYYQKANGRWARYGKYEAASAGQLVEICETLRGAATLSWTNFVIAEPTDDTAELENEMLRAYHEYRSERVGTMERHAAHVRFLAAKARFHGTTPTDPEAFG